MLNFLLLVTTILLAILSFALGIFSLWRNPKSKVVRLWFLMSMAVGVWSSGLILLFVATFHNLSGATLLLYSRILHIGAAFIPIIFCHFVLVLTYQNSKRNKLLVAAGYAVALILAGLSFTKYIIPSVGPRSVFDLWPISGQLYWIFVLCFWVYSLLAIYFLFQGYRRSDGVLKKKIFYILIAALIGFLGGGTCYLPQTLNIYPFGQFFTWLYPILITYGIFVDEIKIKIKF